MNIKRLVAALAVALSSLALVPAIAQAGGGGGGGTVAGPCGRLSGVTASPSVTISGGTGTLTLKGSIVNCSIYQQRYWINVDEPAPVNPACAASALYFPNSIWSSGSSQSFTISTNIVHGSTAGCAGTHTVRLTLKDRSFGYVQQVVTLTYTVK